MSTYAEFFAGGGMVSQALSESWTCVFANDNSARKASSYLSNFSHGDKFVLSDISNLVPGDIPEADLFWASFPCQDLSVAGSGAGLKGTRSGLVFEFWRLIGGQSIESRPEIVCVENVVGSMRSNSGKDFETLLKQFRQHGYTPVTKIIDAIKFLPQSRPRLFIIGFQNAAHATLAEAAFAKVDEVHANYDVDDIIDHNEPWDALEKTEALIEMMSQTNRKKVGLAQSTGRRTYGFCFKRTRWENGQKRQRAEVRFDGIAGCLRTPTGGSSRQIVLEVCGKDVRSRLLGSRETARLMGLPDTYKLPEKRNDALYLAGDGVAVPVVEWLDLNIFGPVLATPKLNIAAE